MFVSEGASGGGRVIKILSEKWGCKVSMDKEFLLMSHLFCSEDLWKVKQNKIFVRGCEVLWGATLFWDSQCKNLTLSSQLMQTATLTWGESRKDHHYIIKTSAMWLMSWLPQGLSNHSCAVHLSHRTPSLKFLPQMPSHTAGSCVCSTWNTSFSVLTLVLFILYIILMQTLENALQLVYYEVLVTSEPGLECKEWNRISFILVVGFVAWSVQNDSTYLDAIPTTVQYFDSQE